MANLVELRNALRRDAYADEESCVRQLLQQATPLEHTTRTAITEQAADLIESARRERAKRGALDAFLEEFDLSNQEGIALMCLAEALLRIPDSNTADALIAEKLRAGDWGKHRGHSDSPFVNASVWGMVMTGKIITLDQTITGTNHWFRNLVSRIGEPIEFQRLHGMGQLLYEKLFEQCREREKKPPKLRVYAPVGAHRDLLPYLVRRLLENGANSSFVNHFLDDDTPVEKLTEDVIDKVSHAQPYRHPKIPLPRDLFKHSETPRDNAPGINLEDPYHAEQLLTQIRTTWNTPYFAAPVINDKPQPRAGNPGSSPADPSLPLGQVQNVTAEDIDRALAGAHEARHDWNLRGGVARAEILDAVAVKLIEHTPELTGLISREAGRTLKDALSEVREAIDFCHYYAAMARQHFATPQALTGATGERNQLALQGRGVFVCISPWNFPLSIFTGQVTAALAAGNTVVAKPAEQTPLIAARAVELMHAAGVPDNVLQLIPGIGSEVGPLLLEDCRVSGVAFTGSSEIAQLINRQLAQRDGPIIPLIAETGGINAMIADSSALPEQLVDDIITSAFLSAGQRCSALRVLFLQDETAADILEMLMGACDELTLGHPWELSTDIGPHHRYDCPVHASSAY